MIGIWKTLLAEASYLEPTARRCASQAPPTRSASIRICPLDPASGKPPRAKKSKTKGSEL